MEALKNIIESLLFVADAPLSLERIREVMELEDTKAIRNALEQLTEEYENRQGGIFLSQVAGGYQIRTRPEYHEHVKRLLKPNPQRLSNAALETLAIIAYKQPIIRSDIEHLRGVDCGGVLRVLMEKKLVRVLGRKEIPGRPLIYATTKHFLEVFELKNLKDLPSPKEIERHSDLPQEKLAAAALLTPDGPGNEPETQSQAPEETPNDGDETESEPETPEEAPNGGDETEAPEETPIDSESALEDTAVESEAPVSASEPSEIDSESPDPPNAEAEEPQTIEQDDTPHQEGPFAPDNNQEEGKKT